MKTHSSAHTFTSEKGTVVTIGTFDGVHIGHKKIIARLTESAQVNQWESVVLTFFPHPRMLLQKDADIKLINTITERGDLLEKLGLDHLVVHPFTIDFSRMHAEDFVEEILVNALHAKKVIIGYDHRFGRNRTANIDDLKQFGAQFGFEVEEISKQELEDVAVSSTKIRTALHEGDIDKANAYLGYPIMLEGNVVYGKSLGKKLGYPTANLHIQEDYKLIPGQGVYVVRSYIEGAIVYGMMNIGTNPTVGGVAQTIETYFFDFDSDLYGKRLSIEILCKIRSEQNFESVELLIEAMKEDEIFSRTYIQSLKV
ncbi:riboflavin biosynthesis protein [Dokdonia pacifica]|uniref:Riboflavin biosynthesis protein n=1 Tax=Dokdonia pacifica TaxID=1627892 RepID=A0A238WL73_9FLAO|nr:bifunctional riboflavin kinase/FAD synthetase [Dokdonia pacifica]GGG22195.1 riboflavin biosynthesis protein [Dokdonia pacifica]SNR47292.1 riboflavin kinase / FMN adenylyltransferase [Dokdonia pacifica]